MKEKIAEYLRSLSESDLVQIQNSYAENNHDDLGYIYPNDAETLHDLCGDDTMRTACMVQFGNWNPSHDYVWLDGNGNLESGNGYALLDRQIFPSDIANYCMSNDEDFGDDDIREILDAEEEE